MRSDGVMHVGAEIVQFIVGDELRSSSEFGTGTKLLETEAEESMMRDFSA